jgi:hypothetical protein
MSKVPKPQVSAPKDDGDRTFLIAMYEEHAEHARQHENLRATVATIFVALIAGIFTYGAAGANRVPMSGALICAISILGCLLNVKHYERYSMHREVLRGYREALELGLNNSALGRINSEFREWHEIQWPFLSKWVRLHYLWASVYFVTFIIGLLMMMELLLFASTHQQ